MLPRLGYILDNHSLYSCMYNDFIKNSIIKTYLQ